MTQRQLPIFHTERDIRNTKIVKTLERVKIVERASLWRNLVAQPSEVVHALEAIQFEFLLKNGCNYIADDRHFKGISKDVLGFCHFSESSIEIYVRNCVQNAAIAGLKDPFFLEGNFCLSHELGHAVLPGHRQSYRAKAKREDTGTSARAALNEVSHKKDSCFSHNFCASPIDKWKQREFKMEVQADYFAYAFLVPISQITGNMSYHEIAERWKVNQEIAYQAAMLAKDVSRVSQFSLLTSSR